MSIKVGLLEEFAVKHFSTCIKRNILDLPLAVFGSPGCGKTEIMAAAAKAVGKLLGIKVNVVILHPVTMSDVDFFGHPVMIDGKAFHVVYGTFQQLIDAEEVTICLFDDVGQSKGSVQAPIMQVIRQRELNGKKISDKVFFALASNGAADKAGVAAILRPLQDRCVIVNVDPDADCLTNFLKENYPEAAVVAQFVQYRPQHVHLELLDADQKANKIGVGYPSHRSFTMLARIVDFGYDGLVWKEVVEGMIGKPAAIEFLGYEKIWKGLVPFSTIKSEPETATIPGQSDGKYAQIGSILHQVKRNDFDNIWKKYILRFPREFVGYAGGIIDRVRKDLTETAAYQEWRTAQKY